MRSEQVAEETMRGDSRASRRPVLTFYRSPWNEVALITVFLIAAWAGLRLTLEFPWSLQQITVPMGGGHNVQIPLPLFAIVPVSLFFVLLHRLYDVKYLVTDDHVVELIGRMSLTSRSSELSLEFVRGIEITRRFLQRFFDVGDVRVVSLVADAVDHAGEVVFAGIRNPSRVKRLIEERVEAFHASKHR